MTPQDLSNQEAFMLLNQWKDTFSNLINSDLDRVSKDSFKIWFLSLACYSIPKLEEEGKILWTKLLEGVEYCKYLLLAMCLIHSIQLQKTNSMLLLNMRSWVFLFFYSFKSVKFSCLRAFWL